MSENNISVEELINAAKLNFTNTATKTWCGIDIEIKHSLSIDEVRSFIETVYNSCFKDGEYNGSKSTFDFACRLCLIGLYTNIEIPEDIDSSYSILYGTDIVKFILHNINTEQLDLIVESTKDLINKHK